MKRFVAATAIAAALMVPAKCAVASSTITGGAQVMWASQASATLALVTQYSGTFVQGTAAPTLLPSAAGVCTPGPSESAFTISFGSLTPTKGGPSACLYKNALAISVQTNDTNGFVVNEYLDSSPSNGLGICAFPNGGASFPLAPATALTTSGRTGNPAAGTYTGSNLTSCAAGGNIVPAGTGGASTGGTVAGNPNTPGLEYYTASTTVLGMMSSASPTVNGGSLVAMYGGEDIQVNLGPGAPSMPVGATGLYITIQLVPN